MAFCNSCGATLEAGAKFCPKCGTTVPMAGAIPPSAPSATTAPPQGSGALKIILIVVAVAFVLGVLGIGTLVFVVRRVAQNSHVRNKDGNVRGRLPSARSRAQMIPMRRPAILVSTFIPARGC